MKGLQLIRGLAQHRPVQSHHRIGGDHHRIHARLLPHGPGLLRRDAAHQLLRGQLPLHVLVNIGGDDAKVLYPHALQKLPPPGRLGGQNDLHTSVPFLIGRRGAAAAALRPVPCSFAGGCGRPPLHIQAACIGSLCLPCRGGPCGRPRAGTSPAPTRPGGPHRSAASALTFRWSRSRRSPARYRPGCPPAPARPAPRA